MTCDRFEQWLDDGRPGAAAPFEAHAGGCARCARALAAAIEVERWLEGAAPVAPAPHGFTDRVMARLAPPPPALAPALAWWVRAAGQPACVLAAAVAALFAWSPDAWFVAARAARAVTNPVAGVDPVAVLALAFAALPGLWWFGERLTRPLAARTIRP